MCEYSGVLEEDLLRIIPQDEVPVIRSTRDRDGNVKIEIVKMTIDTDSIAISHIWACGLGNFQNNTLPQCQQQAIDWYIALMDDESDQYVALIDDGYGQADLIPGIYQTKTWHYWLDTLCIPLHYPDERKRAINSMERICAGAAKVLVLGPCSRQDQPFRSPEDRGRVGRGPIHGTRSYQGKYGR